jgi:hypothetical protein
MGLSAAQVPVSLHDAMSKRSSILVPIGSAAAAIALGFACSAVEENQPGNFSALAYGVRAPGLEGTATAAATCPAVPLDAASPAVDAGADGSLDAAKDPLAPPNISACATIFVQKIVPYVRDNCLRCHAAPNDGSLVLAADPMGWRDDLVKAKTKSTLKAPYVDVCTTDPQKHPMYCNIVDCAEKGKTGNPMPLGKDDPRINAEEKTALEAWVRCGSPK